MIIEKGKTLNGYAISVLFMKNNADLWLSGRYFFMEIPKSNTKTDKSFSDLSVFLLILFQITIHSYPTGVKFFTALFLPNID